MADTQFNYEIIEHVATLSENGEYSKELNLVSYNGSSPKFDLRGWRRTGDGAKLLKGLTLTDAEISILKRALNARQDIS